MKNVSEDDADFCRISKSDFLLIGLIIFFSVVSILGTVKGCKDESLKPQIALIYHKERLLEELDLSKDKIITILDGKMQIEAKNGKLRVLNSDCPQALCVKMGCLQYSGQVIVCLPNQVLIELESEGPALLDAVAY